MRVVICGAGVIGASIAYYLARRGIAATLVERERPACAASGKSAGFLALDWCDGSAQDALARASYALHAELAQSLGTDCGYRTLNTLLVAASDLGDLSAHHRSASPGWLDGRCAVAGTIGTETTTAQVHPGRLTQALVDAALHRGAKLHTGAVQELVVSADGSAARGVVVDGDTIEADAVVIAMGPWSTRFADALALPAVNGLKGYSITLRPASPMPAQALFVEYQTAHGEQSSPVLVTRPDGEAYMCGLAGDEPLPEAPGQVSVDQAKCAELQRMAGRLSGALGDAEVTATQACYRPLCADALPLIGRAPAVDGAYVATGHNCWGILNAPGTGLAMSELLLDGEASSIALAPFDPGRFAL